MKVHNNNQLQYSATMWLRWKVNKQRLRRPLSNWATEMFGLWAEILWQFERRRKYTRWSCGTNRARAVVAKAVTLILALGLFYLSVHSSLGGTTDNAKLNILTKPASSPLRKEISSFGHHLLKLNGLEDNDDSKNVGIIAAAIINRLARNFHRLVFAKLKIKILLVTILH